jgi:threonylcarbamoyladenosine tRNA methylthiotransferase MtaB
VYVVHSCAVTHQAELDSLRLARRVRREQPGTVVVLAGCLAQYAQRRLTPGEAADLLVPQKDKFRIPALLHELAPGQFPLPPEGRTAAPPTFGTTRALVKAQDGCDFRCAYCVVPAARGPAASRPLEAVVAEARNLAAAGFREVVVTGANLGCYRDGNRGLVDLLRAVEALEGIARVRISSIELSTVEREVIDWMAVSPKLCRFLHLPLQSGDDRILAAMGRRYTRDAYRRTVEYAASRVPRLGLGADLIVGFPGEDEAAFANTVALVEALPFGNLHVFPFSPRPDTRAAALPDAVPAAAKKERVRQLLALGNAKRAAFARGFVGRDVSVLIERLDARGAGRGWTGEYVETRIRGPALAPNALVTARVTDADGPTLLAALEP